MHSYLIKGSCLQLVNWPVVAAAGSRKDASFKEGDFSKMNIKRNKKNDDFLQVMKLTNLSSPAK